MSLLAEGFSSCVWKNEPGSWGDGEGKGSWCLTEDKKYLEVIADSNRDYWQKTYYRPLLVKDDGPRFVVELPTSVDEWTMTVTMELNPKQQFDQGGLFVRYDGLHWIKAGIEFVGTMELVFLSHLTTDGVPKLSCVVTNDFSDWSTQAYVATAQGAFVRLRIHKVGHSFVFEATSSPDKDEWAFVRIAYVHQPVQCEVPEKIQVGVFACCPVKQDGCVVKFGDFSLRQGTSFDHNADGVI